MTADEIKRRIVSAAVARHRARTYLEAAFGPGSKNQRERRRQYRIINQCEKCLEEAAAQLDAMKDEQQTTINGLV